MDRAEREDILLSLMRQVQLTGQGGQPTDIADSTGLSTERVREILSDLVKEGEVICLDERTYHLSPAGMRIAETIMRRHRVLECFLQEILGMDHAHAHAQACTMEHHTSDDTINRLRKFIRGRHNCKGICHEHKRPCALKSLAECNQGDVVRIDAIRGCSRGGRLADLGLIPGEHIIIRQKMADTLLIRVKDCDIAISPEIAHSVLVEVKE